MNCPTCHIALQPSRDPNGAIWICDDCAGAAANLAVLRKRLQAGLAIEFWRETLADSTPSPRPCPSCSGSMKVFRVSVEEHEIALDICKKCQIIWFDGGELEAMPKAAPPEEELSPEARRQMALFTVQHAHQLNTQVEYQRQQVQTWIDRVQMIAYILIRLAIRG